MFKNASSLFLAASTAFCLVGCENLPGDKGSQGAVIGGAGGATVGAAVGGSEHRLLGALLGGALGAAGGYVVGANSDRILGRDRDSADEAARTSQQMPATSQDALQATTADVNQDGFVTLDEVVAMKEAGFSDTEMLNRMRATDQVFELTADQRQYLADRGVSQNVIGAMETINSETRDRLMTSQPVGSTAPSPVISQPPSSAPPRY